MIEAAGRFVRGHWQLLALTALVFALWRTDLAFPFRLLVVLFHELGHGAAALLTGGSIEAIELSRREGGVIWTRGGNRFLISSSGYLGSLLIGLTLMILAVRTRADRAVLGMCGGLIILATALYIREVFTLTYCLAVGTAMVAIAWALRREAADLLLRVIGLISLLYVPWDIWTDTIRGNPFSSGTSDAAAIAERSFGTEAMWGGLWLILSLLAIALAARLCLREPSNLSLTAQRP